MLIAATSLSNDLEGQDFEDAARSTVAEQASSTQMLAVYDGQGRLVAKRTRPDLRIALPPAAALSDRDALLGAVLERDGDDRHRLAFRRVSRCREGRIHRGREADLEPMDEELEFLRGILGYVVPIALVIAAIGGSFLARRTCRRWWRWPTRPSHRRGKPQRAAAGREPS